MKYYVLLSLLGLAASLAPATALADSPLVPVSVASPQPAAPAASPAPSAAGTTASAPAPAVTNVAAPATAVSHLPAPAATVPFTDVEFGGSDYGVTNNRGDWSNAYVSLLHQFQPRNVVYATASEDQRFGYSDRQYVAGGYASLGPSTIANVEAGTSPTHNIDPRTSLYGSVEQRLADGWGAGISQSYRSYNTANAATTGLYVDRYWGNNRAAVYVSGASISNVPGLSVGERAALTHWYGAGAQSSITGSISVGRDVENVGTGIVASNVFETDVIGTNWIDHRSALVWDATYQHFGELYSRAGLSLGYRHRF